MIIMEKVKQKYLEIYDTLTDDEINLFGEAGFYIHKGYSPDDTPIVDSREGEFSFMGRLDFEKFIMPLLELPKELLGNNKLMYELNGFFDKFSQSFYVQLQKFNVDFFTLLAHNGSDCYRHVDREDYTEWKEVMCKFLDAGLEIPSELIDAYKKELS
jgi:hypothetical protein